VIVVLRCCMLLKVLRLTKVSMLDFVPRLPTQPKKGLALN